MKKYLLGLAVLLMGTAVMTSCDPAEDYPETAVVLLQTRLVLGMQLSTTLMQRPSSSFLATVLKEFWRRKA